VKPLLGMKRTRVSASDFRSSEFEAETAAKFVQVVPLVEYCHVPWSELAAVTAMPCTAPVSTSPTVTARVRRSETLVPVSLPVARLSQGVTPSV
jgi:hypothetical protein